VTIGELAFRELRLRISGKFAGSGEFFRLKIGSNFAFADRPICRCESSDRIEMSGLSSPAAFIMSTISVETTARLTIC
jgi:hypothetical protein